MSGGLPVYRKMDNPDWWLMYYPPYKMWMVQTTANKGRDLRYAGLKCDPPCLPERGPKGTWEVRNGGKLQPQAGVDISIASPEEVSAALALIAAEAEALAVSVRDDGPKVCVCACVGVRVRLYIYVCVWGGEERCGGGR